MHTKDSVIANPDRLRALPLPATRWQKFLAHITQTDEDLRAPPLPPPRWQKVRYVVVRTYHGRHDGTIDDAFNLDECLRLAKVDYRRMARELPDWQLEHIGYALMELKTRRRRLIVCGPRGALRLAPTWMEER